MSSESDIAVLDFITQHAVSIDHDRFANAVCELESLVSKNTPEHQLQTFLEQHLYILSQQFSHCHHVIPKVKLGAHYEADFFCLDIPSSGKVWHGVELEIPQKKLMTKSGRKSAALEHALQQIRDWRRWTAENLAYARNPPRKDGIGLWEINPRFIGKVIIGRRSEFREGFHVLRQQIYSDELIDIQSWDRVVEWGKDRAKVFGDFATSRGKAKDMKAGSSHRQTAKRGRY